MKLIIIITVIANDSFILKPKSNDDLQGKVRYMNVDEDEVEPFLEGDADSRKVD